jgi:hypothetical protein
MNTPQKAPTLLVFAGLPLLLLFLNYMIYRGVDLMALVETAAACCLAYVLPPRTTNAERRLVRIPVEVPQRASRRPYK